MSIAVVFTSNPKTFTPKTSDQEPGIVESGGSGWWVTSERSLKHVTHVIACHNAHDSQGRGNPARHGEAFLIGKFAGFKAGKDRRKLLKLSEIADISIPGFWEGRNPVRYSPNQEIEARLAAAGFPLDEMPWVAMDAAQVAPDPAPSEDVAGKFTGQDVGRFVQHALTSAQIAIAEALGLPTNRVRVNVTIDPVGSND